MQSGTVAFVLPAVLLGQCTGAEAACELPRALPWWFSLLFFGLWLAALWGVVLLVRYRLARRRSRRGSRGPSEHSNDVELW